MAGRRSCGGGTPQLQDVPPSLDQRNKSNDSCVGLGAATNQAPETFLSVLDSSERLERILSLALLARDRSDITMFEAYVQTMSQLSVEGKLVTGFRRIGKRIVLGFAPTSRSQESVLWMVLHLMIAGKFNTEALLDCLKPVRR